MSGALGRWRDRVAQQLRDSGLNVVTAMDPGRAARWREPVAAAAVSQVVCAPGGFQDYLGMERDGQTGEEREVYGREAELTLALDIFAPRDGGGEACRKAAETAVECLACRGVGTARRGGAHGPDGIFGAGRAVPAGGGLPVPGLAHRPGGPGGRRVYRL